MITNNPSIMGGKPCIDGTRVTVGTIVGLLSAGYSTEDIIEFYPYLVAENIKEALEYAAWRADEIEVDLEFA